MKSKIGQPTKFRKEYCDKLVDHMEKGLSFDSFSAKVRVCNATLYNWLKEYPEFAEAKKVGSAYRLQTLEAIGLKIASKGGGSASAWIFFMKNAYGWKDRLEINDGGTEDEASKREQRVRRIAELEAKRKARERAAKGPAKKVKTTKKTSKKSAKGAKK